MITATPPAKMKGLFRGDAKFAEELCKIAADSYAKFAEDSPQDEQDVSTVAPTEFSMASPTTDVEASRSQRRHERRKQKKREKKIGERQKTSTPEHTGGHKLSSAYTIAIQRVGFLRNPTKRSGSEQWWRTNRTNTAMHCL